MTVPWQGVQANRNLEVVPSTVLRYSPDTLVPYEGQAGSLNSCRVILTLVGAVAWNDLRTLGDLPQPPVGHCLPGSYTNLEDSK